jgi:hypothetical protein
VKLFDRVTLSDLLEVKEVIEHVQGRIERLQKNQKAQGARNASYERRLRRIELMFKEAVPVEAVEPESLLDNEEEEVVDEDIEMQRLRLGRGQ